MNKLPFNELHLSKIELYLLGKKRQIDAQLKSLKTADPVLLDEPDEVSESGTEAWKAEVHNKSIATQSSLKDMEKRINTSLQKLKDGTYGICDKCGQQINWDRLQAIPMTSFCRACV